jgi:hypothetical protein
VSAPLETCPGCGLRLAPLAAPGEPAVGASPSCWARYGDLLAAELSGRQGGPPRWHRLTVDAYAVQHPGEPGRRQTTSVCLHLVMLLLVLEEGMAPDLATTRMGAVLAAEPSFTWLEPPSPNGTVTVADVLAVAGDPVDHEAAVWRWAEDVWRAWAPHHDAARAWARRALR